MKTYSREEMLAAFSTLNKSERPIHRLAIARRSNSAIDYDSKKLLAHSKKTAEKRAKSSLKTLAGFAGRKV